MAKKIKTITEEESIVTEPEAQPEIIVDAGAEVQPPNDDLQTFLDQYGSEEPQIKIYKFSPSGKLVYCNDATLENATESYIQSNWGEGQYRIWLLDQRGKYLASKKIYIGKPPGTAEKENLPHAGPGDMTPGQAFIGAATDGIQMQIEMLRQQMSMDRELMKTLIEKVSDGRNGGGDLVELARALTLVKEMSAPPPQPTPGAMITELVGILKTGIELGASGVSGEPKGWLGIAKEIAGVLPDVLRSLPQAARGMSGSAEGSAPVPSPDPQQQLKALLTQGIQFLKTKAQKGSDPNLYVDIALDNVDQPQWAGLIGLVDKPFDEVANFIDPELLNPFYRPWFEQLFNGIRDALHDRTTSSGPGDDNADPKPDGGPNP